MEEVGQRGGKPCSQHRLKQMFAAADLNHNGVVDFNEFCVLQQKKALPLTLTLTLILTLTLTQTLTPGYFESY